MAAPHFDSTMSRPTSVAVSPQLMRPRTLSISSDRPSTIAYSLMSAPLSVSPEPVFIAASAASQIVTNDHDSHADMWYDQHGIEPAGETALVSQEALRLVNSFLDHLLFNFLQTSKATTLAALRPAVTEILKPKLAKDAVNNADEELREYLGAGDEDDYVQPHGADVPRDWDVELVWKRTRLRCMVYSSLGDMEEEDEDLYMEQENLEADGDEIADVISPAVAIFLTSVLEYMGELTLTVAGQAAYHRLRAKLEKEIKDGAKNATDIADRIVVEEGDMERVALDRTLGRLWRGWKKRIRSPVIDNGRRFSGGSLAHLRQEGTLIEGLGLTQTTSHSDTDGGAKDSQHDEEEAAAVNLQPSEIALPVGDNDVDEIEVPGLAVYSDEELETEDEEEESDESFGRRPKSLLILPFGIASDLPTPTMSQPHTPVLTVRKRSNSLPTPGTSPYRSFKRSKETAPALKAKATEESEPETKDDSSTDEQEAVKDADTTDDPTPKASTQPKRLSKIITATPAAAAMTSITAAAQKEADTGAKDEVATYEKAEIMTSSRVSVAGSISPALSDTGGPFPLKRSSSVHSARIIDVTGPKSPTGSRPPSVEATDRVRPSSVHLSRNNSISNVEEPLMPKVLENVARSTVVVPKSRSPVDRMRESISNSATISESDEETESTYSTDQVQPRNATFQPSPLAISVPEDTRSSRQGSHSYAASPRQHQSPTLRQGPLPTKPTMLRTSSSEYDEKLPEVPRKSTGHNSRQFARSEKTPTSPTHSIGMVSVERMKTKDSDEEAPIVPSPGFVSRPIHTSGSSQSSHTSRLKAMRTSEENISGRSENVARNFEELIKGNQTITYTLTPENMRDIESKHSLDGPAITKSSRKSDDVRGHSRSSSAATDIKGSPSRFGGLGSLDGRSPKSSSKSGRGPQARDARIPSESTADFAQFIKSTGPVGDNRPPPLRNVGSPTPPAKTSLDTHRVSSTSNRNRYQPRDAAIDRKGNSDLIDFIRQGPPGAAVNRIPKSVAPFMDADDIAPAAFGAPGGRAVDATIPDIRYSQASTHVTDTSMPSIHSSINSNTALLKNKGGSSTPNSQTFGEDDMMPKRKTRRVKDPYALDFSDEDDDDDFITTPKPPAKKEESLAEFLRNYEPPPEPVTVPISQKIPKKKASAPSLIGRFTRGSSNHSNNGSISQPPLGNDNRPLSSRNVTNGPKGYIPIQVNMPPGYDKYGAVDRPAMPPSAGSAGRVPMKRFEPRDAVSNVSRTSDLASFLRNSEPPPEPIAQQPVRQEESSGFSKMFGRRKK